MNSENNLNNNNNNFNSEVLGSIESLNNQNVQNNINTSELQEIETLDTEMNNNNNNNNNNNLGMESINQNPILENNNLNQMTSPPIMPEPAYTNPQTINAMPGFENNASIGTTPPISLEPEKQPKKKKNKTWFVVIIILLLFGVGFGTYYVLNYTDLLSSAPKIIINTKNIEINMGDELSGNISDYASVTGTDIKNCSLNTDEINTSKEGVYSYNITCGDLYKKGTVTVVDNSELIVNTKKVYKVKNDTIDVKEFISNLNEEYTYEFVNQEEINGYLTGELGTYPVKIKVTSGTKTLEVNAELVILEHKIKGYLTCSSKEQTLTNSSTKKVVQNKFAIADDGNSGFGKVAEEIHVFKFQDETEYTNYLATYNSENTLTIDNITGDVIFEDDNLTIKIKNVKTAEEVTNKYGENNMLTYGSIRKYFMDTLGYECTYALKGME